MKQQLKNYLQSFNLLTEIEIENFLTQVTFKQLKKGDFFIKEGKTCKEVAFIISGLFRSFYYSSTGEEVTYCFIFQDSFMTAYSSFITQTPTAENFEALSDVELFVISKDTIDKLEKESTNWLRLLKLLAEQEYIKMEQRVFLLQKESAEKRYEDLLMNHPDFLQFIPLHYLSSYLGITQRHLSRIRKSLSN